MQDRIKEHDRNIRLAHTQTSAVSDHANETGHFLLWNQDKFIDRDPIQIRLQFILITSIETVELKFLKHGYI